MSSHFGFFYGCRTITIKINSEVNQEASNIYLQFEQPQSSAQHLEAQLSQHEQHQSQTQISEQSRAISEQHQEPTSSDSSTSIKESKRTGHGKRKKIFLLIY